MHSAYCSPTVNTHLAKIINYSNKELARPGTCPAWSGVGVWVAWAQALCSSHCDGWQQLYWRYLAGLYCLQCWKYILLHLILTQEIHDILREFCVHDDDTDAATCAVHLSPLWLVLVLAQCWVAPRSSWQCGQWPGVRAQSPPTPRHGNYHRGHRHQQGVQQVHTGDNGYSMYSREKMAKYKLDNEFFTWIAQYWLWIIRNVNVNVRVTIKTTILIVLTHRQFL